MVKANNKNNNNNNDKNRLNWFSWFFLQENFLKSFSR